MAIIEQNDLPNIKRKHSKQQIVYCSGCFDLTHAGHVLFFEDCKKHGDILVVGVGSDRALKEYKGKERPIINEHMRMKMVDSIKGIDYVFLDDNYKSDDPYLGIVEAIRLLKPDVYVFNGDAYGVERRKEIADEYSVKLILLERWAPDEYEEISTSSIIGKIKNL